MSQNKEVSRPLCQRVCWQCFKSFGPARPVVLSAWSKLSTARSPNVFRAFKSKDTSTDEDEGQKTKSKKTFSFSVIFKERKMVTPTRIIQKNWSRTFYMLYPPPLPSPTPPPPLRKRDSRELNFAWTPAMPAPACSYWLNWILHMMSF